jgi:hypothetical protein
VSVRSKIEFCSAIAPPRLGLTGAGYPSCELSKWEEQSAPAVEPPIWTTQWLPSDQQSMETILSTPENASRTERFVRQSIDRRAGATIQMRREYVP